MEKKITKAMRYEDIIAILNGETPVNGTTTAEAIAFIAKEQEQNAKKNKGKSKAQEDLAAANDERAKVVLEFLADRPDELFTASDISKHFTDTAMTSQRITYLLGKLIDEGRVTKSTDKRKSVYQYKA